MSDASLPDTGPQQRRGLSRRGFLSSAAAVSAVAATGWRAGPAAAATPTSTAAVTSRPAVRADVLADLFGVSVVTSRVSDPWDEHTLIKQRLQELGVRHLRCQIFDDTYEQWPWMKELGAAGFRFNVGLGQPDLLAGTPEELVRIAAEEIGLSAVASFEGPNEWDIRGGDSGWAAECRAYQQRLFRAVNGRADTARIPLLGPSLGWHYSHSKLGNLASSLDVGNIHLYTGGYVPGFRLDEQLKAHRAVCGSKKIMVTETGWHNSATDFSRHNYTPEEVAGVYAPRLLLEYLDRKVIPRFFVFHLVDDGKLRQEYQRHFGLLRADFSKKPAFEAYANLLRLVNDGRAFSPAPLTYGVTGGPADLKQALAQRSDGSHLLFLWRSKASIWDPERRLHLKVAPVTATVSFSGPKTVLVHRPSSSVTPVSTSTGTARVAVPLAGEAVVLQIR